MILCVYSLPCSTLRGGGGGGGGGGGKRGRYTLFRAGKFVEFDAACVRVKPVFGHTLS